MPTDPTTSNPVPPEPPLSAKDTSSANNPIWRRLTALPRFATTTAAAIALLALGGGIGAVAMKHWHGERIAAYAALPPVAITAMTDWSTVEIKGQVAEIFGNKFVLQDPSGRALVETGRQGEDGALVAKDEAVEVQGRFEHGFVHAEFIVYGDGKIVALQPPHGPPQHGPLDWVHGHHAGATPFLAPPRATS
jgi:uncharacterized protein YdeI (BOF family)